MLGWIKESWEKEEEEEIRGATKQSNNDEILFLFLSTTATTTTNMSTKRDKLYGNLSLSLSLCTVCNRWWKLYVCVVCV